MKSLVIAGVAAAALSLPAAALAQTRTSPTVYGSVGYAGTSVEEVDLGAIQGRLGARFNRYLGAEGELALGLQGDDDGGFDYRLNHQVAGYVVGFVPLSPNIDLIARGGYGQTRIRASDGVIVDHFNEDSWNYGAGAQYYFNRNSGIRADWTRHDFGSAAVDTADVWSVGYSHRF